MSILHLLGIARTALGGSQGDEDQLVSFSSSRERMITSGGQTGATTTVGWVVADAITDIGELATLAASATSDTLIVPLSGLSIGDVITAISINGQIESGGGNVTVDAQLHTTTITAAGNADASIGSGVSQVAVSADSVFAESESGLDTVVEIGKQYWVLVTATTAGSTDVALTSVTYTANTPGGSAAPVGI